MRWTTLKVATLSTGAACIGGVVGLTAPQALDPHPVVTIQAAAPPTVGSVPAYALGDVTTDNEGKVVGVKIAGLEPPASLTE